MSLCLAASAPRGCPMGQRIPPRGSATPHGKCQCQTGPHRPRTAVDGLDPVINGRGAFLGLPNRCVGPRPSLSLPVAPPLPNLQLWPYPRYLTTHTLTKRDCDCVIDSKAPHVAQQFVRNTCMGESRRNRRKEGPALAAGPSHFSTIWTTLPALQGNTRRALVPQS